MYIYNITIKVDNDILHEWMQWQREEHIPEMMDTKLFDDYKFFRLLDVDDSDGPTFVIQYYISVKDNYDQYIQQYAPAFREKALKKWSDGFIAFRTLLEPVQ